MSIDFYRRQVAQHQNNIAKLQIEKGKAAAKAAQASKKSLDATAAAGRSRSASTITSKLRDAQRYATEEAKAQAEIGKIEVKIANENKKFVAAQGKLDQELTREQKKRHLVQQRTEHEHERRMRAIHADLSRHEQLHAETASLIEKLMTLPEEIVVSFFAADPGSTSMTKLALDEEARSIGEKIRASEHRDSVTFVSRWAVRPMDILQAINELSPTVVHFSGHGSSGDELVLQDDQGRPKFVRKEAIVHTISVASESVKLVFFNTCFSFNQAQECVTHVNAAVGMNKEVGDRAARIFASQFYSAIGFGLSIPKAFAQAKAALMMEDFDEANTPELYLKDGITEEELILVRPPQSHSAIG